MPELSAQLPAIIGEAAKSPLGIFALMIISLAILGFFFFKEASEKTRIAIFSMLFVGVAVFGLSIVRTTSTAAVRPADDPNVNSILGTWTADVSYFPPTSFRETFEFETVGGELLVKPTFTGTERGTLDAKVENGVVRFEIKRQEIAGEVTTDIRSTYAGVIHPDRIEFRMRSDNGDREATFQARRAEPR